VGEKKFHQRGFSFLWGPNCLNKLFQPQHNQKSKMLKPSIALLSSIFMQAAAVYCGNLSVLNTVDLSDLSALRYYGLFTTNVSFSENRNHCVSQNGTIAIVRNTETLELLTSIMDGFYLNTQAARQVFVGLIHSNSTETGNGLMALHWS
jgi:hypothetical protein